MFISKISHNFSHNTISRICLDLWFLKIQWKYALFGTSPQCVCINENGMSQSEGVMVMCVRGFVHVCVKEVFYDEFVGGFWCSTLLFPPALCPHTPGESWVMHWLTVYRPSSQPDSNSTSLVSISMFVWVPLCLLDPCPLKHTHSSVVLSPVR